MRVLSLSPAVLVWCLIGCGGVQQAPCPDVAAAAVEATAEATSQATAAVCPAENRNLHAVLWTQTATEFDGVTIGLYRAAAAALPAAIADASWTAAPEQLEADAALPPAVILDLDETVLDNSAYQAWLAAEGASFSPATWGDWCNDGTATLIPGAAEYLQTAADLGVTVFYVTNREAPCEEATVANLQALGIAATAENVVVKGEIDAAEGSNKGIRRAWVAEQYRIVQLLGDNLGDFVDGYNASLAERDALVAEYADYWGTRWIALPNPQYGSWPRPLSDGDDATCDVQDLYGAMTVWSGPND